MIQNIYPLSPLQAGMYFHALRDPASSAYFQQAAFRVTGDLRLDHFEGAWNDLIKRHDILRTLFTHQRTDKPKQVVLKERPLKLRVLDRRDTGDEACVAAFRDEELARPFDLAKDPLLRVGVVLLAADRAIVVWSFHHILMDGWCQEVLLAELLELYGARRAGRPPQLPPPVQYRDYIRWLQARDRAAEEAYWSDYLAGLAEPSLVAGTPPASESTSNVRHRELRIDAATAVALRTVAGKSGATLNTAFQCAWAFALATACETTDVVFGATVSGRPPEIEGIERMIGLCINAVPVRFRLGQTTAARELLAAAQASAIRSQDWHYASLADIQARSGLPALFDHLIVFENYPLDDALREAAADGRLGFAIEHIATHEATNYPLVVTVVPDERSGELSIRFDHREDVVDAAKVETLAAAAQTAIEALARGALPALPASGSRRAVLAELTRRVSASPAAKPLDVVVAGTFTVDPLAQWLGWWAPRLDVPATVEVAPYDQVMQQLLDRDSVLSRCDGVKLLCVRMEDWLRDLPELSDDAAIGTVAARLAALQEAFASRAARGWTIVCQLPLAIFPERGAAFAAELTELCERWLAFARGEPRADVLDLRSLAGEVATVFDPLADAAGHVPFTEDLLAAAGAACARRLAARMRPPFKVLALDCDNTLWGGVCGEVGPLGIALEPGHLALQKLAIAKVESGFLVVLVSKNNPEDVWRVFDENEGMLLRREHLAAVRLNWQPKSENLRSLAQELSLGLDSFVFLDDSGVECTEVMTRLPEVLTLPVPDDPAAFPAYLTRVWALDRLHVTAEDRERTGMYRAERARQESERQAGSLEAFLDGLALEVDFGAAADFQIERVAQLSQRTNQFNATTRRRTATDVEALRALPERRVWAVQVRDKFGDYGLVGALLARHEGDTLLVEDFLLSCRALGRGVEDALLVALARQCRRLGAATLALAYRESPKNRPFVEFLERCSWDAQAPAGDEIRYRLDASRFLASAGAERHARPLREDVVFTPPPASATAGEPRLDAAPARTLAPSPQSGERWRMPLANIGALRHLGLCLPLLFPNASQLAKLGIESKRTARRGPAVAPRTPLESQLLDLWRELLGVADAGVLDDFFALGGHSLKAIQLLSRVHAAVGVEVSLREVLDNPTVAQLALVVGERQATPSAAAAPQLTGDLPLSYGQRRLWVTSQTPGGQQVYNLPAAYRIDGPLDVAALERALQAIVARHEALRTTFFMKDGEPRQRVEDASAFQLVQLGDVEPGSLEQLAGEDAAYVFDLERGPLFRARLGRLSPTSHVLFLNLHHIACDGWSHAVLTRELGSLYAGETLPPPSAQYRDFVAWQSAQLAGKAGEALTSYWHDRLGAEPQRLALPTDRPRPRQRSYRGATQVARLPGVRASALTQLAAGRRATLFAALVTAVRVLLHRHARQAELPIATPVSGRGRGGIDGVVGFCANTVPLVETVDPERSFAAHVEQAMAGIAAANDHQHLPFDRLIDLLELPRDPSRAPLCDVMVVVNPPEEAAALGAARVSAMPVVRETSLFDLVFELTPRPDGDALELALTFDTALFDASRIEAFTGQLARLLAAAVARPDAPLATLDVMSADERRRVCEEFPLGRGAVAAAATIPEAFADAVRRHSARIALIDGERALTYAELDAWSATIAADLRRDGVAAGSLVAVLGDRSAASIAALLGVMRAGAVYLPLDPDYPAERQRLLLDDSGARCILLGEAAEWTPPEGWSSRLQRIGTARRGVAAPQAPRPEDLAYAIYTSGSTGRPKGVALRHAGFVAMAHEQVRAFGVQPDDRVLQFASPGFDAALSEIFMALFAGAALVLVPTATIREPESFLAHVALHRVSVVTLPPVYLRLLDRRPLTGLRVLISAGEAARAADLQRHARTKSCFNAYGPTETSVCATIHAVDANRDYTLGVPIGRPIAGTSVYVLDASLQPVPPGAVGEVVIGGSGVAAGYLGWAASTEGPFLADPVRGDGARCYRTGDLAYWTPAGELVFLGRRDHQVKVRGQRVELEEVRQALTNLPQLRDAHVCVRDGELVAYFVPRDGADPATVRSSLARSLPAGMLPSRFVTLDRLPMTVHGKVDERSLPEPAERLSTRPLTADEQRVATVWESVLGRKVTAPDAHFFASGGDSIRAIQVVARLREQGLACDVKDLFEHPTIEDLATRATAAGPAAASTEPRRSEAPLGAIQAWFWQEVTAGAGAFSRHHFNHAVLLRALEPLDWPAATAGLTALVATHEALRLRFVATGRDVRQELLPPSSPDLDVIDLRSAAPELARERLENDATQLQKSFVLDEGPLFKARGYRLPDGDRLLLVAHHLCVDAVSWRILAHDLETAYVQAKRGVVPQLPAPTTSTLDWAATLRTLTPAASETAHWQAVERTSCVLAALPAVKGPMLSKDAGAERFELPAPVTAALLGPANERYETRPLELLLAALGRALGAWAKPGEALVTLEGHGREIPAWAGRPDFSRTVGWLTSIFPLALPCDGGWREQILAVRARLRDVPGGGFSYGLQRLAAPSAKAPRPCLAFNFLGHLGGDLSTPRFALASESTGPEVSPLLPRAHALELDAGVQDGVLRLVLTHHLAWCDAAQAARLAQIYVAAAGELVAHCQRSGA